MMFISRVKINSGSLAQVKLLKTLKSDDYAAHRLIWKLFPDQPAASRDFLYRQEYEKEQCPDSETRHGMPVFYVVSGRKPTPVPDLLSVMTKPYRPILKEGMTLGFILRANPVVARAYKEKKNSVRHDVLMDAKKNARRESNSKDNVRDIMQQAAIDWLVRKSGDFGFTIADNGTGLCVEINAYRQHRLYKPGRKEEIRFSSIDYRGVLEVSDPALFCRALFEGLGKSKSFGCGLMMVRRI